MRADLPSGLAPPLSSLRLPGVAKERILALVYRDERLMCLGVCRVCVCVCVCVCVLARICVNVLTGVGDSAAQQQGV